LISRQESSAASYYIYDGGLSVRALTNEAGTVTDTLVFDAFGNETAKTGSTDNSYGFQGEEKDETGLYYLRARYMDPSTGTFTSMDTYGGSLSDPMSLHKYLFANSNPVIYCDPSGHDATLLHMVGAMGMGALLSAASYLAVWAIASIVDTVKGTNYSAGFNLKDLICSVALGALLGGLGWEFSVAFQSMHLTLMQYVGLSVFLILIGLDLKVWSYFEGKSGDVIWSAILGTLGDTSYVAGGAAVGAAVNARNNPLGLHDYSSGSSTSRNESNSRNNGTQKYKEASWWKRLITRRAQTTDLKPNPYDEFSDSKIGPSESALRHWMNDIRTNGKLSEPIIVKQLSDGGYEIVDGHHKWLAAKSLGVKYVPIKIINT
jgi:RHS repeat-associated protein